MNGGAGDDELIGGLGDDLLVGDEGIDTASYQEATGGVTANLTTGVSAGDRGADTFSSIENLTGGAFNDQLDGNGGANVLNGGAGLDNLFGRDGDDTLIGGLGNDFLAGGDGIDTASYSDATGNVEANLTTGVSAGNRGADEYLSIENLTGGGFDDLLIGDDLANVLSGLAGDDVLEWRRRHRQAARRGRHRHAARRRGRRRRRPGRRAFRRRGRRLDQRRQRRRRPGRRSRKRRPARRSWQRPPARRPRQRLPARVTPASTTMIGGPWGGHVRLA